MLNFPWFFNAQAGGGYEIEQSLRFSSENSTVLSLAASTSNTSTKFTFSFWMKPAKIGGATGDVGIWRVEAPNSSESAIQIGYNWNATGDAKIGCYWHQPGSGNNFNGGYTNAVYRDPSAWYHFVIAIDTTQASGPDRFKVYANGVLQDRSFDTANYIPQNYAAQFDAYTQKIGEGADFYLAEFYLIRDQALAPTDFGEFDNNGVWRPIEFQATPRAQFPAYSSTYHSGWDANATNPTRSFDGNTDLGTSRNGAGNTAWSGSIDTSGGTTIRLRATLGVQPVQVGSATDLVKVNNIDVTAKLKAAGAYVTLEWIDITAEAGAEITNLYMHSISGTSNPAIAAIDIDGEVVVDADNGFGPNGFFLDFSDPADIGADRSGNGNNWTATGFNAITGSSSWSFGTQRENDYTSAVVISGITGFTSASFSGTYAWGGNTGGTLNNAMQVRDSSDNTVIASTSVSGASGSWSLTAPELDISTTYHLFISATCTGSSYMTRDSSGSFTTSYGGETDMMSDTPTTNWCTWNALNTTTNVAFSNGNLDLSVSAQTYNGTLGTIAVPSSGKWYWEASMTPNGVFNFGIAPFDIPLYDNQNGYTNSCAFYRNSNDTYIPDRNTPSSDFGLGDTSSSSDVFQVAFDADTGKVWLGRNNTWYWVNSGSIASTGNPSTGTNETRTLTTNTLFFPWVFMYQNNSIGNFGQRPFAYTPPTGYKALNTANLPAPTVKDGSDYFNTVLYTGNGTTQSITGVGFKPDFVWIKSRSNSENHMLVDGVRQPYQFISSNTPGSENNTTTYDPIYSLDDDGFTVKRQLTGGFTDNSTNQSSYTYAAWNWKAGATAGFDIVTYTGNGGTQNISHTLGVVPRMIIVKNRDASANWYVYHTSLGTSQALMLNTNSAAFTPLPAGVSAVSSSNFTLGSDRGETNKKDVNYVAYCFAEVEGYSKFGSYIGNGSTDGSFVYCGFKPAVVLTKCSSNDGDDWRIWDNQRPEYNPTNLSLAPNTSAAEDTSSNNYAIDTLSNGFKLRSSTTGTNGSGRTYIFMALAEHPTGGSGVSPATAR